MFAFFLGSQHLSPVNEQEPKPNVFKQMTFRKSLLIEIGPAGSKSEHDPNEEVSTSMKPARSSARASVSATATAPTYASARSGEQDLVRAPYISSSPPEAPAVPVLVREKLAAEANMDYTVTEVPYGSAMEHLRPPSILEAVIIRLGGQPAA